MTVTRTHTHTNTDELTNEQIRKTLLMLAEKATGEALIDPCGRCGHGADEHRYDDSGPSPTDPAAVARCVYPVTIEGMGVVPLCTCPSFVPSVFPEANCPRCGTALGFAPKFNVSYVCRNGHKFTPESEPGSDE